MTSGALQPLLHASHPRLGLALLCQQQLRLGKHDRGRDKLLGCFSVPDEGYGSLTHTLWGSENRARERVTGCRKGVSESSLSSRSRQIGHRGKLHHSWNKLIRDVLEDAWLQHLPVSGSLSRFTKSHSSNCKPWSKSFPLWHTTHALCFKRLRSDV